MAIRKILAAGMLALSMAFAVAVVPAPAEAKTKVIIGIGGNYGGYYGGGCWNGPYYLCGYRKHHHRVFVPRHRPVYYYDAYPRRVVKGKIGCGTAKDILQGNGYRNIVARDCQGTSYSFKARKKGHNYIVRMSARNGRIVGVSRL
jgi:ribosomal protein L34